MVIEYNLVKYRDLCFARPENLAKIHRLVGTRLVRTAGHNPCRRIGYGWAYLRERSESALENRYPDHELNDIYYTRWRAQPEEVDVF